MPLPALLRRWGPAAAWMAVIFVASSQARVVVPGPDWGLHAAAYFVLGVLVSRGLDAPGGIGAGRLLAAVAACVVYGLSDEWHQSFVPGRHAEGRDVLMDAVGAVLGALAYAWWRPLRGLIAP